MKFLKSGARVILAIVASTVSFVFAVYLLVQGFGSLPEDDLNSLLKVSAAVALIGTILIHLPLYFVARTKGISHPLLYVLPGAIIPSLLVAITRPFGSSQIRWIPLEAGLVAILGAVAAIAFWFVAPRGSS